MKPAGLQGGHQPLPDFCQLDFPQAQKIVNRENIVKYYTLVETPQSILLFAILLLTSTMHKNNFYFHCVFYTVFFTFYFEN